MRDSAIEKNYGIVNSQSVGSPTPAQQSWREPVFIVSWIIITKACIHLAGHGDKKVCLFDVRFGYSQGVSKDLA